MTPTRRPAWLNFNLVGAAALVAAVGWSFWQVATVQEQVFDSGKRTLRIAHWQLEAGYREALAEVIREYEKLHPDVRILQAPTSERVYTQWLNTAMLSGDGPDLIEMGDKSKLTNDPPYISRFFFPLTEEIGQPNPYNAGTFLADTPWRDTFVDGMQGAFKQELQDYYSAPTTVYPIRLFYNKQLIEAATGRPDPPDSLGGLLETCAALRRWAAQTGTPLVPIAGSDYAAAMMFGRYGVPFLARFEAVADLDLGGTIDAPESYLAYRRGLVSLRSPEFRALYECLKALASEFTPGFMAAKRDDSVFDFVQGRAAMIATGAWDATSLYQTARFPVGVMDMPLPQPGERWGEFIAGRANEAATSAEGRYGIYKFSHNRELAIDFLRFLTSLKGNELFCQRAGLVPAVIGAHVDERMRAFRPNPEGFHPDARINLAWDPKLRGIVDGLQSRFLQGEFRRQAGDPLLASDPDGYERFAAAVDAALTDPLDGGDRRYAMEYANQRGATRNAERVLAVQMVRGLYDPQATDALGKYRRALLQQVRGNAGRGLVERFEKYRGIKLPQSP